MKFQEVLEYKTQTQISQYKKSNQIYPQQPPKIQIKKRKKTHQIRERKNPSDQIQIKERKNPSDQREKDLGRIATTQVARGLGLARWCNGGMVWCFKEFSGGFLPINALNEQFCVIWMMCFISWSRLKKNYSYKSSL